MKQKILVVENDKQMSAMISKALKAASFDVVTVPSLEKAKEALEKEKFDLVIIEDDSDSKELLREIRTAKDYETIPIIFLGKGNDIDRIIALEMGADDYVTRPFNTKELISKIKAIFRRIRWDKKVDRKNQPKMSFGRLEIDKESFEVKKDGKSIHLTPLEFDLLCFLAENEGRVFSRETLLDRLWGYDYFVDTRTVDVHIRRLRTKIEENPSKPRYIITVRGKGYKFVDPDKEGENDTLRSDKEEERRKETE